MKTLKELLKNFKAIEMSCSDDIAISSICIDSRKCRHSSLFVAIRGAKSDGHNFIEKAIKNGARAVICEELPNFIKEKATYIKAANTQIALAQIARNFYGDPSSKLKLVGVTGTNGKTTTATLLYRLFRELGFKSGLISTVRNMIGDEELSTNNTTPDSLTLNELMDKMVKAGCKYCFMEVSSHSVVQHRIDGLKFAGAIFTNLTHDHLDYHGTFEEYLKAKQGFLNMLESDAFVLSNLDDENAKVLDKNSKAMKKYFSLKSPADFECKILQNSFDGLLLDVDSSRVKTKLIGSFNAYNFTGIYGAAILLGQNKDKVLKVLSELYPVEGRFQHFKSENGIVGIVDYAHTPDAVEKVLKTIRDIRKNGGKIITVIGCGGDRDATKRPIMAKIAWKLSDVVILTSDNPRSENPEEIIEQMKKGLDASAVRKTLTFTDRREAIEEACSVASQNDIILLAGKGHEKYQEIKGIKYPFDDMEELRGCLK
ncbi:MAG: UDP-N-acetylmuramoyl-L-alanyl-D-glutamate--2,6-diaminopimelate ligase [Patescibacteria group bacterium]|nr:UDP-N-acetylmuramoyl-L-alanyl-D-glutamate--2,6-diaminopimelate ligase [Patescibacteria group bacterium]MDE1988093.1 UDP-N-acetylmuramoyl-L-alanyl-D-glutamate--2,6-diaminopimelate ligase [Patescibacteria group bacterium]MDE2218198.1 UDP-N-acetylmuramoyl-L-alanyl-D-glutamate--2,6-diaminopimelate ligase [Patescibacteria group bacterium]